VKAPNPITNLDEPIERVVGRRTPPADPFRAAMELQAVAVALHQSLGHRWARKGVYRFSTHQEANEWNLRMLAGSQKRSH